MTFNDVYEKIGLDVQDTPEHEAVRQLLQASEIIEGDFAKYGGGVPDFYVQSQEDETAYDLADRLNELCGVFEIECSFYVARRHI